MSLLTLSHVSVSRADRTILHDLSFTLDPGQAMLVTGENGSGKSTLLRTIAGLCPLDQGILRCNSTFSWLGHHNALKLSLTVRENLTLLLPTSHDDLLSALTSLALSSQIDTPVRQLSAGQQRRVAFARLLLSRASLWLLDEPTTSMDARNRDRVDALITHHCQQGGGALIISHTPMLREYERLLKWTLQPHASSLFLREA